jgi:hypothetical protein
VKIAQGVYYKGFGFHAFRREAVTELAKYAGANQAQRMAGHAHADISRQYTQADLDVQTAAVLELQNRVRDAGIKPQQHSSENRVDRKLLKTWYTRGDSNARPLPLSR